MAVTENDMKTFVISESELPIYGKLREIHLIIRPRTKFLGCPEPVPFLELDDILEARVENPWTRVGLLKVVSVKKCRVSELTQDERASLPRPRTKFLESGNKVPGFGINSGFGINFGFGTSSGLSGPKGLGSPRMKSSKPLAPGDQGPAKERKSSRSNPVVYAYTLRKFDYDLGKLRRPRGC
jgi:hypothetical protein